ncbi:MAG TPA: diguanylate cyclase, partial [Elusimicrobiota bacterium]|nr:diguanylate cyclase [Elusimicrobiota bacterium]
ADLNNFKSFNDKYGFLRGDQAIKLAAQCILSAVEAGGGEGPSFVGHIGGDDFVLVAHPDRVQKICDDIIGRFDSMIPNLYDESDRRQGHIMAKNRQGQVVQTPLMGIAMVIVNSHDREFEHPGEISSLASELKTYAKSFGKSVHVTERRKPPEERPPTTL